MWGDRDYYKQEIIKFVKQHPTKTARELFLIKPEHIRVDEGTFSVYLSEIRKEGLLVKRKDNLKDHQEKLLAVLKIHGNVSSINLAKAFKVTPHTMNARLHVLKRKGLLENKIINGVGWWSIK